MKHSFEEGKIVIKDRYFADALYHLSNECISVILNGRGAIVGYAPANEREMMNGSVAYFHRGAPIDVYADKTVCMIGRQQKITLNLPDAELKIVQFLSASENCVFFSYELDSRREDDFLDVAFGLNKNLTDAVLENGREVIGKTVRFGANIPLIYSAENQALYLHLTVGKRVCAVVSCGTVPTPTLPLVDAFDGYEAKMQAEIESVYLPIGLSEMQKALYYSAYFCALENYKCMGEYKAFMAGHRYLLPMRSYYRDSYYTVLPMYRQHPELVRNQIVTLAMGIGADGSCPSAVRSDYTEWWGNHYDSPSFLAMMLEDYVKHVGDLSVLSAEVKGESVLKRAEKAVLKLASFADETHLICKEGPYNQRDWADEVNRNGYVTYDNLLYARALICLARLFEKAGDANAALHYRAMYEEVKTAINTLLFDEELGYYVNFKDGAYVEKNLSIDTCFAALFGIADDARAVRMLENMERILETKHNVEQKAGDYGVMCVYPFYSRYDGARNKSSQPYYYHNGANWPYLSSMYAAAKRKYGMEYRYALESWFDYNVARGNYTPIEFFSPPCADGSLLQAWAGVAAFVMDEEYSRDFWD